MPLPEEALAQERTAPNAAVVPPRPVAPTPSVVQQPAARIAPQVSQATSPLTPNYGSIGPGAAAGTTKGMDPTFAERLQAMVAASSGRLTIVSGYRSDELQAKLFADAVKKYGSEAAARKWVAPPGKSNHNKGIAADLGGDIQWAHDHAAEFGLYFPMQWEPWHIEPAGSRSGVTSTDSTTKWTGPKATQQGYTSPPAGYSTNPDPGVTKDPRSDIGYQLNQFASIIGSPDFWNGGPAALPADFTSMPRGTV